jgi:hypothetical protein
MLMFEMQEDVDHLAGGQVDAPGNSEPRRLT